MADTPTSERLAVYEPIYRALLRICMRWDAPTATCAATSPWSRPSTWRPTWR